MATALWLALHTKPTISKKTATLTDPSNQIKTGTANTAQTVVSNNSEQAQLDKLFSKTIDPSYARYRFEQEKIDPAFDWKQPINFYGYVIDESNSPVANAQISFEWNDLSERGTSKADTKSDANGFFSLLDRRGKRLYVDVAKDGYYSSGNSRGSAFEYANPFDGLFRPDPNHPVVFHLRKKGVGTDLNTSQHGIAGDFQIHIPRDGTPIQVDFMQRKTGAGGQMQITENKPEFKVWKSATNWWFRLEISDGGLIEQNDEFQFTAPENGYTNVIKYNFQQGQPNWSINFKTNYYIKFGNPPRYGWLQFQTGIAYGGAILIYAINPDGSRNLEPK